MSDLVGDDRAEAPRPASVVGFPPASNAGVRARASELRSACVPFVMATVVRAERPTSAKAGDVAIVHRDGTIEGFVGGECAETSVQLQALRALASGQPVLLRISPESAPGQEPAAEQGTVTVHNPCLSGGTLEIFLEPEIPPPVMVVQGDSPIARALASLAERAGYVVELLESTDTARRDGLVAGAAAVVVASHGRGEEATLTSALKAAVPYIGLVASRTRGAAVLDRLELAPEVTSRIHTPAGLDLGARGAHEIAVSILAEIIATRHLARGETGRPEVAESQRPSAGGTVAAGVIDPVCGMAVAAVTSTLFAEHGGKRYFFCGSGCRDAFASDPEGFLARS